MDIQIRLWDDVAKEMVYLPNNQYQLFFGFTDGLLKAERCGEFTSSKDITLMLYTNRRDKHGNKIYDQDIVSWNGKLSKVVYKGTGFWIDAESFGDEGEDLWDWDEIEVVGNTFQSENINLVS